MTPQSPKSSCEVRHDGQARHELKYLVPADIVPDLRFFVQPFCIPDGQASGDPPEYQITTLQLDTIDHALHSAKERKFLNRFKLRVRSYGEIGMQPAFLEIKRKLESRVIKSRCRLEPGVFGEDFSLDGALPEGLSNRDRETYFEFARLVKQMDARPQILIRYIRESWVGLRESSVRATFDRALEYAVTDRWSLNNPKRWLRMDSGTAFGVPFAPAILELKCSHDLPFWMQDMIRFFSLNRKGICKYSTAVRLESLFEGNVYSQASENTNYF